MRGHRAGCTLLFAAACAAATPACSVLLDWNEFAGGAGDAGSDGTSGGDAPMGSETGPSEGGVLDAGPCPSGLTCFPAYPSGWTPVTTYVGPGPAPACPSGYASSPAFQGTFDLDASPASCSSCACGAATAACSAPVLSAFIDDGCNVSTDTMPLSTSCAGPVMGMSYDIGAPEPGGGSCAPTGGTPSTASPTWGAVAIACAPSASPVCAGGSTCAPKPAGSFSSFCVMQPGTAATCPAPYSNGPTVVYDGQFQDGRGCSACTCGPPSGVTCSIASPAVAVYTGSIDCLGGSPTQVSVPTSCTTVSEPVYAELIAQPQATGGSCAASGGGTPTGSVTPMGATTFCCEP